MSDVVVHAEKLSKRYRLGQFIGYKTLRESLSNIATAPLRRFRPAGTAEPEGQGKDSGYIWALKDVSFEVKQGEAIGIIGRNGAGKTTLLKILTRITTPTEGFAEIRGRVGSLLEVGTGFHPELTGEENIYLYGSILGMKRAEVARKFDEIVSFAGVEKFIDTPLKRYSSGMQVRLAFAVAAHLEPEILLVDEVLAVGDAVFQKKCLGKMGDVTIGGRTVLFVSHNMVAVLGLCQRAILLDGGRIVDDGPTQSVVEKYLSAGLDQEAEVCWTPETAPGGELAKLRCVRVRNHRGEVSAYHQISNPVTLELEFWVLKEGQRIDPVFHVFNGLGVCVFITTTIGDANWGSATHKKGLYRAQCTIPGNLMNNGQYRISAFLMQGYKYSLALKREAVSFEMFDDGSTRGDFTGNWSGIIRPAIPWSVERMAEICQ